MLDSINFQSPLDLSIDQGLDSRKSTPDLLSNLVTPSINQNSIDTNSLREAADFFANGGQIKDLKNTLPTPQLLSNARAQGLTDKELNLNDKQILNLPVANTSLGAVATELPTNIVASNSPGRIASTDELMAAAANGATAKEFTMQEQANLLNRGYLRTDLGISEGQVLPAPKDPTSAELSPTSRAVQDFFVNAGGKVSDLYKTNSSTRDVVSPPSSLNQNPGSIVASSQLNSNSNQQVDKPNNAQTNQYIAKGEPSGTLTETTINILDKAGLTSSQRKLAENKLKEFSMNNEGYKQAIKDAGDWNPLNNLKGSREFVDKYFTGAVVSAVKNPGNVPLVNIVNGLVSGKIKLSVEDIKNENGNFTFGRSNVDANEILMNMNAKSGVPGLIKGGKDFSQNVFINTLAHEGNHYVNDKREPNNAGDNADRFWNEYRSFVVGVVAAGVNPKNLNKRIILDNLIGADPAYNDLRTLYACDSRITAIVNKALSGDPNDTFSVNDMRRALINGGFNTPYIQRATNANNNLNGL